VPTWDDIGITLNWQELSWRTFRHLAYFKAFQVIYQDNSKKQKSKWPKGA
jgi:hypothetical protein